MTIGKKISLIVIFVLGVGACGARAQNYERTVRVKVTCEGDPADACKKSQPTATQMLIDSLPNFIPYFSYKALEDEPLCGALEVKVSRNPGAKWKAEIRVYGFQPDCPPTPMSDWFPLEKEVVQPLEDQYDSNGLNNVTKADFPQLLARILALSFEKAKDNKKNKTITQSLLGAIPVGFGAALQPQSGSPRPAIKGTVTIKPLPGKRLVEYPQVFATGSYHVYGLRRPLDIMLRGNGCRSTDNGLEVDLAASRDPFSGSADNSVLSSRENVLFLLKEGQITGCSSGQQGSGGQQRSF
jgi:hypothetical protein